LISRPLATTGNHCGFGRGGTFWGPPQRKSCSSCLWCLSAEWAVRSPTAWPGIGDGPLVDFTTVLRGGVDRRLRIHALQHGTQDGRSAGDPATGCAALGSASGHFPLAGRRSGELNPFAPGTFLGGAWWW
jgi:hypothetical protein